MSGLTPPAPATDPLPATATDDPGAAVRDGLTTLSVVVAWFTVAALLGALVWWQVTPLAEYTRTRDNASMDEEQLAKQFGADGWFFVIAAVGGLVSGLVLALVRRRNPVLLVLLLAVGGALATFVMVEVGRLLGPSDPSTVLASTPVGATVPLQLEVDAHGVWFVWSIAALVGAIIALWISESRETSRRQRDALAFQAGASAVQNHP